MTQQDTKTRRPSRAQAEILRNTVRHYPQGWIYCGDPTARVLLREGWATRDAQGALLITDAGREAAAR